MQLCGEGFMIASSRNDDGSWDWRTFGTGEGFTADLIVTGFLSADRIQAHSIRAHPPSAAGGHSLDPSRHRSIRMTGGSAALKAVGYRVEICSEHGDVLSDRVPSTTLRARVWQGSTEVTDGIDASRFVWTRQSSDETADRVWNAAHTGVKEITLTTADVLYSANYFCDLLEA